jgi:pre-mRNA-processing factor 39
MLQGDLGKLREAYDEFLSEYPLCYGYWKKYADSEHKHGSTEMAKAVIERGVAAVPNSVELWVHYSNYLNTIGATPSEIRR